MLVIGSDEEHENEEYQLNQLRNSIMVDKIECKKVNKIAWHTWFIVFNRQLTYLERHGIMHILCCDELEPTMSDIGFYEYKAWWD